MLGVLVQLLLLLLLVVLLLCSCTEDVLRDDIVGRFLPLPLCVCYRLYSTGSLKYSDLSSERARHSGTKHIEISKHIDNEFEWPKRSSETRKRLRGRYSAKDSSCKNFPPMPIGGLGDTNPKITADLT